MKEHSQKTIKPQSIIDGSSEIITTSSFTSITRVFLSSATSRDLKCPRCGHSLNFTSGIEWIGPDSFTCGSCQQLINIRLIQRALKDLGVE